MTVQKSINLAISSFIAVLAVALLLVTFSVSAQEGDVEEITPITTQENTTEETTEQPAEEAPVEATEESVTQAGTFDYVAQSGDSYSLIARKAVQTYGIIYEVELTEAQIIFIETNLTINADSPLLTLGQQVTIDIDSVAEWVEKAQELTEEQQQAWQVYANNANFNTDSVGEARN